MSSPVSIVDYHLWTSTVRAVGTSTVIEDPYALGIARDVDASVEISAEADQEVRYAVATADGMFKDASYELAFSDDGRLVGLSRETQGQAGKVVASIAKLAGSAAAIVAKTTGNVLAFDESTDDAEGGDAGEEGGDDKAVTPPDPETDYAAANPAAAEYRRRLREGVSLLRLALISSADELIEIRDPAELALSNKRRRALKHALDDEEQALVAANAHFAGWRESQRTVTVTEFEFSVSTGTIPLDADVAPHLGDLSAEILGPMWPVFEALDLFITIEALDDRTDQKIGNTENVAYRGVFFRRPRPVALRLYKRERPGDAPRLISRHRHLIVDEHCTKRFLSFESSVWGERRLKLTIGALGSPVGLTASRTSGAGAVADALAGMPAEFTSGLDEAIKAGAAIDKVRDDRLQRHIDQLKRQLEARQAAFALDHDGLDVQAQRDLAELERRQKELEIRKAIADLERPPAPQSPAAAGSTSKSIHLTLDAAESS